MNDIYQTVIDQSGTVLGRHLTTKEAAHIILTDDSAEYEIREATWRGSRIFELWTRKQVANEPWSKTIVTSFSDSRDEAESEIFLEVCEANWRGFPEAIPDAEYDAMLADLVQQNEGEQ